jgi:hypothetical protein
MAVGGSVARSERPSNMNNISLIRLCKSQSSFYDLLSLNRRLRCCIHATDRAWPSRQRLDFGSAFSVDTH